MHASQQASEMNTRQQAAEPGSNLKASDRSSSGSYHLDHPAHRVNCIAVAQQRVEPITTFQNWFPLSRLMTPHMDQVGMKTFITSIMRLSGRAEQAFRLVHLASVKGQITWILL